MSEALRRIHQIDNCNCHSHQMHIKYHIQCTKLQADKAKIDNLYHKSYNRQHV